MLQFSPTRGNPETYGFSNVFRGVKGNMGKKRVKDKLLCLRNYNLAGGPE